MHRVLALVKSLVSGAKIIMTGTIFLFYEVSVKGKIWPNLQTKAAEP